MSKYISYTESVIVDSGTQSNVAPATGTAAAEFIVTGTQTAVSGATITVTGGSFNTSGIKVNDIVADFTNGSIIGAVLSVVDNDNLTIVSGSFPNGAVFRIYRPNVLFDSGGNFTNLKVAIGDTVTNTVTNATALVTALNANNATVPFVGTALTLDANIFGANYADLEDNYTVTCPANELFDNNQNFLTTVSIGDEVIDTTSSSNAIVISVLSDFRLKLSESIMAVSDNFNILSATGGIQRFINSDAIILVDQFDTLRTDIFCEGGMRIRLGHDTTPSKQSKIVVAFQNAMLRAQTGAGGPEPVVMPPRIYILDTTVTSLPAVS